MAISKGDTEHVVIYIVTTFVILVGSLAPNSTDRLVQEMERIGEAIMTARHNGMEIRMLTQERLKSFGAFQVN